MAFKSGKSIIDETDRHRTSFGISSFTSTSQLSGQLSLFSQSPADSGLDDYGNNYGEDGYGKNIAAKDGLIAVYHPSAAIHDGATGYRFGLLFIYDEDGTELSRTETYSSSNALGQGVNAPGGGAIRPSGFAMGGGVIAIGHYGEDNPISPNPTDAGDGNNNWLNEGAVKLYSYGGKHIKDIQPHIDGPIQQYDTGGQQFGHSVDIGCGLIVVGAPHHSGSRHFNRSQGKKTNRGTAYVYNLKGNFLFELEPPGYPFKHRGEEVSSDSSAQFGWNVAVGNGIIAVSAPFAESGDISEQGKVFLYDLNGRFLKAIRPPDNVTPTDNHPVQYFGYNNMKIGNGRIYVSSGLFSGDDIINIFKLDGTHVAKIDTTISTNLGDGCFDSIAVGYGRLVIGDDLYTPASQVGGRIFICDRDGTLLTTVNNPSSDQTVDYFGGGLAIMKGNVYIGVPRYSNNRTGYIYKRPLETVVEPERKEYEDVFDMILGGEAYADSDRLAEERVTITYHIIGAGGGGAGGEVGNVPADFQATEGGDGGDSYIAWGSSHDITSKVISKGGQGGDDNVRNTSQAGGSSNWLGTTRSGGAGGQNSDSGNWSNGSSAPGSNYGAGGGSGGTSFETNQGGNGGSAATYKTGTVKLLPGTEITIRVGTRGSRGGGAANDTVGGFGAHGRVRLVIGVDTFEFTETYTGTFRVPTHLGYE